MPRPRFQNLPEEKRLALIEKAAKEFSQYGYEQASLNRILESAGMSKGAAYYYFDDKADVFVTTVRHFVDTIFVEVTTELMQLNLEDFWPSFKQLYYEHLMLNSSEDSWRVGVLRALFSMSSEMKNHSEILAIFEKISQWVERLLGEGQKQGTIRNDLPKSLLIHIAINLDTSIDAWFIEEGKSLPEHERMALAKRAAELMQKVLEPQ